MKGQWWKSRWLVLWSDHTVHQLRIAKDIDMLPGSRAQWTAVMVSFPWQYFFQLSPATKRSKVINGNVSSRRTIQGCHAVVYMRNNKIISKLFQPSSKSVWNYFKITSHASLLQLMTVFKHVQCRWNNFSGWNNFEIISDVVIRKI